ncbi:CRP-like cAMP-binding protein [Variovorax boronicumulans]|uniref:Crp/Fnr family transcriptional regulator n=1 Tax=Variovorax boronicumulans TaxID=436515 RepID=UPI002781D224|nr:helix-turn-helix domain-containing protein [Variovorax boronicumulans]MDP9994781.1 CRP-like cAMP-binding protein [Variovorax boronicumulans]MDQ0006247.1 CRP-like cAMP-binding protein [Variovorax boronicumulans]
MNKGRHAITDLKFMDAALRKRSAFSSWSSAAMNKLLARSYVGRHSRGHVFSSELHGPTETFLLVSGEALAACVFPQRERFAVMLLGPGVMMGITQVLGSANRAAYDFSAHREVMAIHMPTLLLLEILDAEPLLWKDMLLMVVRQHVSHVGMLRSQIEGALRRRVVSTIDRLAGLYGDRVAEGGGVRLQLSQSNLAEILQANRQAIHKELKALANAGAIALEYNALTVLNQDALKRMVDRTAA